VDPDDAREQLAADVRAIRGQGLDVYDKYEGIRAGRLSEEVTFDKGGIERWAMVFGVHTRIVLERVRADLARLRAVSTALGAELAERGAGYDERQRAVVEIAVRLADAAADLVTHAGLGEDAPMAARDRLVAKEKGWLRHLA
jgi:hypothetical protein